MNEELQHRVETLLLEADPAANSATNGLMDRGDLQQVIAQLGATIRQLKAACESLKRERDALIERLSESSACQQEILSAEPSAGRPMWESVAQCL